METFNEVVKKIDDLVWGLPMIILIIGCGILLTIRLRGIQIHKLGRALKYMFKDEEQGSGEVSSFQALCTALSATIGTGNIVGVATALAAGGPGALLWMEIAAFFGMATKYAEVVLALRYRRKERGQWVGGAMYCIRDGMGKPKLAALFAWFALLASFGTTSARS